MPEPDDILAIPLAVELHDSEYGLIASRTLTLRPHKRCLCYLSCHCSVSIYAPFCFMGTIREMRSKEVRMARALLLCLLVFEAIHIGNGRETLIHNFGFKDI